MFFRGSYVWVGFNKGCFINSFYIKKSKEIELQEDIYFYFSYIRNLDGILDY